MRLENKTYDNVHEGYVSKEVIDKRIKFFRQELIAYVFKHYREEKRHLEECNPDVAETIEDDEDLDEWPDFFDLEETPKIPMAPLK